MNDKSSDLIENHTFEELSVGQSSEMVRALTLADIRAFAAVSGDTNPSHLDEAFAHEALLQGVIAHGMWGGSLISALLGTKFPGSGTVYLEQSLSFVRPVHVGDTLVVRAVVLSKDAASGSVDLNCSIHNQKGEPVLRGVAKVRAPSQKTKVARTSSPTIHLWNPQESFKALLMQGRGLAPALCAVVHPCDAGSLSGAMDSARHGLIIPLLVGPRARILAAASENGIDINGARIVDAEHSHGAAALAAEMAAKGEAEILMKGSLHTDELMMAVLRRPELRTGRRMSHVFRFDVPMYSKPILITDAALNIKPTLMEKADIVQNAIDLMRVLGVALPKVAILSAVETVNPNIPSTMDAAALCKMADRGQIKGGMLDGPLAFDNAISKEAARIKGIKSEVAGDADIFAVPDLESGNMLAKQLEYLAGASGSGVVLGARIPIALTSRADGPSNRVSSALLALLMARKSGKGF